MVGVVEKYYIIKIHQYTTFDTYVATDPHCHTPAFRYTACMKCIIIYFNFTALIKHKKFEVDLGYKKKYIQKINTVSIKETYLSEFKFINENIFGDIFFLYSELNVFGSIFISNSKNKVQFMIRQLHRQVTIIEEANNLGWSLLSLRDQSASTRNRQELIYKTIGMTRDGFNIEPHINWKEASDEFTDPNHPKPNLTTKPG